MRNLLNKWLNDIKNLFYLINQIYLIKFKIKSLIKKPHSNGPILEHLTVPQFQIVFKNKIKINTKSLSDSYIGFKDQLKHLIIFKVFNICHNSITGKNIFLVKHFEKIDPFFDRPISSIKLGIAIVKNLSESYSTVDIENTDFVKYMISCGLDNMCVAYPILHSYDM